MTEFPRFADALREANGAVEESNDIVSMLCLIALIVGLSWVWLAVARLFWKQNIVVFYHHLHSIAIFSVVPIIVPWAVGRPTTPVERSMML